jgi:hypothetical protein
MADQKTSQQQQGARRRGQKAQEGAQERARRHRPRACIVQQHDHHDHRPAGQHAVVGDFGRLRLPRLAQEHAVCGPGGCREGRHAAQEHGVKNVEVRVGGPGPGTRVGSACAQRLRPEDHEHCRRHADTAQRLPSAEEASRLRARRRNTASWRDISVQPASSPREGTDLFLKSGAKPLESKCKLQVPPGGIKGERRQRLSDYGTAAAREAEAAPHVRRARASVPQLLQGGRAPHRRHRRDAAEAAREPAGQRGLSHGLCRHARRGAPAGRTQGDQRQCARWSASPPTSAAPAM